ncbi:MAG TPA: MFS transporter [Candidatus Blautia faecavium]|uniref:MFS transporter n=1 Tax=Candidatus Blautia faecavium TaxID=2838487 RepID=A0A9D2LU66_9FIRM|nr:MFS transporter [Candidatus Blautia faecavium]
MEKKYYRTLYASYLGYVTQAIVNNFAPLLFVTFQREFSISVAQIGFLVTYNFAVQMIVDLLAAKYVEKIGYKISIVAAHLFSVTGLVGLGLFPGLLGNPYGGLMLAITVYAIGGGLIEVLVSPIVQALPMDEKSSAMSLLHSFYCWGHVLVVILSTVFFNVVGINNWRMLTVIWAAVPFVNMFLYAGAPIKVLVEKGEALPVKKLFTMKIFWLFFLLMICSGAAEQAMSQWASYFAESGLKVSKTLGDLMGPCMFAVLMGASRTFYGVKGEKIPLKKFISISSVLCALSYLLAVFAPVPVLSLVGCALCGLSVGIMWPGVFSLGAEYCPQGGTAMFAFFALAGDIGCSGGPSVVGVISNAFGGNLKTGLFAAIVFPVILLIGVNRLRRSVK